MEQLVTAGGSVATFFRECLRVPAGPLQGQPFELESWQKSIVDWIYEVDEDGLPAWKITVLGIPRGNGKSPMCAGLADFELTNGYGSPQVYCTAAARSQAGIVHEHANQVARGGPLEDFLEFPRVAQALGPIKNPHNGGVLRVLSADGDLQQGLVPAFVAEDEPHTFKTAKQIGLHFAMTTALHKRPDSRMVMITTAGDSKDSLLGELVDAIITCGEVEYRNQGCLTIARDREAKRLLIWFGAPDDADISDPEVWRACNPASWITDESLRIAAASNPESEFRRFYLNQWVLGENAAIQPAQWDGCMTKGAIPPESEVWVGVDLGERRDHAGIVIAAPRPNGRLRVKATIFDPAGRERAEPAPARGSQTPRDRRHLPRPRRGLRPLADARPRQPARFRGPADARVQAERLADGPGKRRAVRPDHQPDPRARRRYRPAPPRAQRRGRSSSRGGWRFAKPKTRGGAVNPKKKVDACIALAMATSAYSDETGLAEPWAFSY